MKKKIFFAAILCCFFNGFLFASVFSSSCKGGKIWVNANGYEKILKKDGIFYIKGENVSFTGDHDSEKYWYPIKKEGPSYDKENFRLYYYIKFSRSGTFKHYNKSTCIKENVIFDNTIVFPQLESTANYIEKDGRLFSRHNFNLNFSLSPDEADFSENGIGYEKVHYVLDGEKKELNCTNENIYSVVKFSGNGQHSFSYYIQDKLGNVLEKNFDVYIDSESPSIKILNVPDESYHKNYTLRFELADELSGVDFESTEYSLDNGKTWKKDFAEKNAVYLEESGQYNILVKAKDNCGNQKVSESFTVYIDSNAPVIDFDDYGSQWFSSEKVDVLPALYDNESEIDYSTLKVKVNDGSWNFIKRSQLPFSVTDEGVNTVTFSVCDAAGNYFEKSVEVKIDRTPAELKVYAENEKEWNNKVVLKYSFKDDLSGIKDGSFKYQDEEGNEFFVTQNEIVFNEDGIYSLTFSVEDNCNNVAQQKVAFKIHTKSAEVFSDFDFDLWQSTNKDKYIVVSAKDEICGINNSTWKYHIDGRTFSMENSRLNIANLKFLENGIYTLQFSVENNAQTESFSPLYQIKLDSEIPEITFTQNNETMDFKIKEKMCPLDKIYFAVDESPFSLYKGTDFSGTIPIDAENNFSVELKVLDKAGNCGEEKIEIKKEYIKVQLKNEGKWCTGENCIAVLEGSEGREWNYFVYNNANEIVAEGKGSSFDFFQDGVFKVKFNCVNSQGRTIESNLSTIRVDTKAPVLDYKIDYKKEKIFLSAFDWGSGTDKNSFEYSFDGTNYFKGSTFTYEENKSEVFAKVCDAAGNAASLTFKIERKDLQEESVSEEIYSDENAPELLDFKLYFENRLLENYSCISTEYALDKNLEIEIYFREEFPDALIVEGENSFVELNCEEKNSFSIESLSLKDGINELKIYLKDKAGNVSNAESFIVNVLNEKPLAPQIKSSTHKNYYAEKTVNYSPKCSFTLNAENVPAELFSSLNWVLLESFREDFSLENSTVIEEGFSSSKSINLNFNLADKIDSDKYFFVKAWVLGKNNILSNEEIFEFKIQSADEILKILNFSSSETEEFSDDFIELQWETLLADSEIVDFVLELNCKNKNVYKEIFSGKERKFILNLKKIFGENFRNEVEVTLSVNDIYGNAYSYGKNLLLELENVDSGSLAIDYSDGTLSLEGENFSKEISVSVLNLLSGKSIYSENLLFSSENSKKLINVEYENFLVEVTYENKNGRKIKARKIFTGGSEEEIYFTLLDDCRLFEVETNFLRKNNENIILNSQLRFKENAEIFIEGKKCSSVNLENVTFSKKLAFETGRFSENEITVSCGENKLTCDEIIFNSDLSASFRNVKIQTAHSAAFEFPLLKIFSFENSFAESGEGDLTEYSGSNDFFLENGTFVIENSCIKNVDFSDAVKVEGREFFAENQRLNCGSTITSLKNENLIEIGKNSFHIEKGFVTERFLIAEKSFILLSGNIYSGNEGSSEKFEVRNFAFDLKNNRFIKLNDFYCDTLYSSGKNIELGKIEFDEYGNILISGSVGIDGLTGKSQCENITLENGKLLLEDLDFARQLKFSVHGFEIYSSSVSVFENYICINSGVLSALNQKIQVSHLELFFQNEWKVLRECSVSKAVEFKSETLGKMIFSSLKFSSSGLRGTCFVEKIGGTFLDVEISAENNFNSSVCKSEKLKLSNCEISYETILLTEKNLSLKNCEIILDAKNYNGSTISFTFENLLLSENKILLGKNNSIFTEEEFKFAASQAYASIDGVSFSGQLLLNADDYVTYSNESSEPEENISLEEQKVSEEEVSVDEVEAEQDGGEQEESDEESEEESSSGNEIFSLSSAEFNKIIQDYINSPENSTKIDLSNYDLSKYDEYFAEDQYDEDYYAEDYYKYNYDSSDDFSFYSGNSSYYDFFDYDEEEDDDEEDEEEFDYIFFADHYCCVINVTDFYGFGNSGKIKIDNSLKNRITLSGSDFSAEELILELTEESRTMKILNAVYLPDLNQEIKAGNLSYDVSANKLNSTEFKIEKEIESNNSINIRSGEFSFKDSKISGNCEISLPGSSETLTCEDAFFDTNFNLYMQKTDCPSSFTYNGWKVYFEKAKVSRYEITYYNCSIYFRNKKLNVGNLVFDTDGSLYSSKIKYCEEPVEIFYSNGIIKNIHFKDKGVYVYLQISLPGIFNNEALHFDDCLIEPNGNYNVSRMYSGQRIERENFTIEINNIVLKNDRISCGESLITFNCLKDAVIETDSFEICEDGSFELNNAYIMPFEADGLEFWISNLSFDGSVFDFSGSIILPYYLTGVFSGMILSIEDFQIDLNGNVKKFYAGVESNFTTTLFSMWQISCTKFGISYKDNAFHFILEKAFLIFPPGFVVDEIEIRALEIDLTDGSVDFDEITFYKELNLYYSGLLFRLNTVKFDSSFNSYFTGSVEFVDEKFPEFLINRKIELKEFQILADGGIGNFELSIEKISGNILKDNDSIYIEDGVVSVIKDEEKILLSIEGNILFRNKFSQIIESKTFEKGIKINKFTFDITSREIVDLNCSINIDSVLFCGCEVKDFTFNFSYLEKIITVNGKLQMPEFIPGGNNSAAIELKDLKIDFEGNILNFESFIHVPSFSIGNILVKDPDLKISFSSGKSEFLISSFFEYSCESLGENSLEGKCEIVFSENKLESFTGECNVENFEIFSCFLIEKGSFKILNLQGENLLGFNGKIIFLKSTELPLENTEFEIENFELDLEGNVRSFCGSIKNINFSLFENVSFNDTTLNFSWENSDVIIDGKGNVVLSGNDFASEIKNHTFEIDEFKYSVNNGLINLSVLPSSRIAFKFFDILELKLNSVEITSKGFSLDGIVKISCNDLFFEDSELLVENFQVDWNGKIKNVDGKIANSKIQYAGFSGEIKNLSVKSESENFRIQISEMNIVLPELFSSGEKIKVDFENVYYDSKSKKFNCDLKLKELKFSVCDFTLKCSDIFLNTEKRVLEIDNVKLKMPAAFGNSEFSLDKISISESEGIKFNTLSFSLPDFKIGEMGFKNIMAEFMIDGEGEFFISGCGSILIPNCGLLEASITFTSVSKKYPVGVKHAFFSYEALVGGIPIGTTGLCLSGIRGGFAYGAPDEVPEKYQSIFNSDGARLQLGLTVSDMESSGKLLKMKADCWVDLTDVAFVLNGDAYILNGTLDIKANAAAIIKSNLFATALSVKIFFIQGKIELYVFDLEGELKFSGKGYVSFKLPKGCIIDKKFITVPPFDLTLGEVGTMFGDFTNGKRGFLGYFNLKICSMDFGRIGAFVGSGGLTFNVNNFEILKPKNVSLSVMKNPDYEFNLTGEFDSYSEEEIVRNDDYYFVTEKNTEDIFLLVGWENLMPEVKVKTPSGNFVKESAIEKAVLENAAYFKIPNVETGRWTVEFVADENSENFNAEVLLTNKKTDVAFYAPEKNTVQAEDFIFVNGCVSEECNVMLFLADSNGAEYFLDKIDVDRNLCFEKNVSLASLKDGTYRLFFCTEKNDFHSEKEYAGTKIILDRSKEKIKPADKLYGYFNSSSEFILKWNNPNGGQTYGYELLCKKNDVSSLDTLGNINTLTFPANFDFNGCEFFVRCCDVYGNKSEWSNGFKILQEDFAEEKNIPVFVSEKNQKVVADSSNFFELEVSVNIENFEKSEGCFSVIKFELAENGSEFNILDSERILTGKTFTGKVKISFDEFMLCENKTFQLKVFNVLQPEKFDTMEVYVDISCVPFFIDKIFPIEINGNEKNEIDIYGSGLNSQCQFFVNNEEVAVLNSEEKNSYHKKLEIPELEKGEVLLSVVRKDGRKITEKLNVIFPDIEVTFFQTDYELVKNKTLSVPFYVKSLNGYDEEVEFSLLSDFNFLQCSTGEIKPDEMNFLEIKIDDSFAEEKLELLVQFNGEKTFKLTFSLKEELPQPQIFALSRSFGTHGSTVEVYGQDFGKKGKVLWNSKKVNIVSWTEEKIVLKIEKKLSAGKSRLAFIFEGCTLEKDFQIYENNFSINCDFSKILYDKNGISQFKILLSGKGENLKYRIYSQENFPFALSVNGEIKCGKTFVLNVLKNNVLENKNYSFTAEVYNEYFSALKEFTVIVKDEICFVTEKIPFANVNADFSFSLEVENVNGSAEFFVSDGNLPEGFAMNENGKIYGRTENAGVYDFEVTLKTESEIISKSYSLKVLDNCWNQKNKDGGNNFYAFSEIPSVKQILWTLQNESKIKKLYSSGKNLIVHSSDKIQTVTEKGKIIAEIKGEYEKVAIVNDFILCLDSKNVLRNFNLYNGYAVWEKENVNDFSTDGQALLICEDNIKIICCETGACEKILKVKMSDFKNTFWHKGECFYFAKNKILSLVSNELYLETESDIKNVFCDSFRIAAVTEDSIEFFEGKKFLGKVNAAFGGDLKFYFSNSYILYHDGKNLVILDKENLNLEKNISLQGNVLVGNEKIICFFKNKFKVVNPYSEKIIWEEDFNCQDLIIFNNKIFCASENKISCYCGNPNFYRPEIILQQSVSKPDGKNGWYVSMPEVYISTEDKETFVTETKIWQQDKWCSLDSIKFSEGENLLKCYSLDSKNLQSEMLEVQFNIDTEKPYTLLLLNGKPEVKEWYNETVCLTLEAADKISGVDVTILNGSEYRKQAEYSLDGTYTIKYFSKDLAGNVENCKTQNFGIDRTKPFAKLEKEKINGLTFITLQAYDNLSGIEKIEYSIDKGEVKTYRNKILLLKEGTHQIDFWAVDKSGNCSVKNNFYLNVHNDVQRNEIIKNPVFNNKEAKVLNELNSGKIIFESSENEDNIMYSCPEYCVEGEFILLSEKDFLTEKENQLSFEVSSDCTVYLFFENSENLEKLNLEKWKCKDKNLFVNKKIFKDNCICFEREFTKNEFFKLYMENGKMPFIAAVKK